MVEAAVRKPRVPNDKLHRVTDNRLAVWCIDNLNTACTVQDISNYVSEQQLSISVRSCFETKSRRRRGETTTDDRKVFRLCIYEEDSVQLLDSSVWPHSVVVLNVVFKSLLTDVCQ